MVGYDDTHLKAALLWTGEGHELELLEYVNPLPSERPTEERSSLGASHLAFLVDDIERTYEHLIARGAQKLTHPSRSVQAARRATCRTPRVTGWS